MSERGSQIGDDATSVAVTPVTGRLEERISELSERVSRQADTIGRLRTRTELAEKSARDAWIFVKLLRGSGSRAQ